MAIGADLGRWDEGYVFTSLAFFNYVFGKYNFSIISNLFDNNRPKPYAEPAPEKST